MGILVVVVERLTKGDVMTQPDGFRYFRIYNYGGSFIGFMREKMKRQFTCAGGEGWSEEVPKEYCPSTNVGVIPPPTILVKRSRWKGKENE